MIEVGFLDANVTAHCTNRCTACSHIAPFAAPYFMAPAVLARDLAALKPILHTAQIHVVGGEPLLHPRLVDLMEVCQRSGVCDQVTVITNGQLLPKMPGVFWQTLHSLQLSVYPNLPPAIVELAQAQALKYGVDLGVRYYRDFFKQLKANDGSSFYNCQVRQNCYTVHEGYFYLCPQSLFFPRRILNLPPEDNGLALAGLDELKLRAFMDRLEPLPACRACGGCSEVIPWSQCDTWDQWLKES